MPLDGRRRTPFSQAENFKLTNHRAPSYNNDFAKRICFNYYRLFIYSHLFLFIYFKIMSLEGDIFGDPNATATEPVKPIVDSSGDIFASAVSQPEMKRIVYK